MIQEISATIMLFQCTLCKRIWLSRDGAVKHNCEKDKQEKE